MLWEQQGVAQRKTKCDLFFHDEETGNRMLLNLDITKPIKTANHVRPSKACTAGCRHFRGGGWIGSDRLEVICELLPGKRVTAPEKGNCDTYEAGHMLHPSKRAA